MLVLALSLVQALSDVGATAFRGDELARLAGVPPRAGHLVLGAGESAELQLFAALPARSVGVWWDGALGDAHLALLAADGSELALEPLAEAHDLAPEVAGAVRPAGALRVSGLVHAYREPAAEARLVLIGPADLVALTAVWIAQPGPAPLEPQPAGGGVQGGSYQKPYVYPRSSWGAYAHTCNLSYCSTTHVGVHHSASSSDWSATSWSQCAGNVKSIQAYHMFTNGWCDIGYNYLACKHGDLFEGRAGGDGVIGAHDGFNCGSMGVCLLGYFHTPYFHVPTAVMLDALEKLSAWKCSQQGIDPFGSSYYAGYGGVKPNVYGHKDVKSTACPGDNVYSLLGSIKAGIAAELGGGGGPASGTLKGVLFDATKGTGFPISGGIVALASGAYVVTGANGTYQFPLSAGNYAFGATAAGFTPRFASETVTSGDVWESLGLFPGAVPAHWVTSTGASTWNAYFQADAGSPIYFAYAGKPGSSAVSIAPYGILWPELATLQVLLLGTSPVTGTVYAQLSGPATPGLVFHSQGFLISGGQWRLSCGAAFQTQ